MTGFTSPQLPTAPYDESTINWSIITGNSALTAKRIVSYHYIYLNRLAIDLKLSDEEVRRRWRQLMYFFATVYVAEDRVSRPPPMLEQLWQRFCEDGLGGLTDFRLSFFPHSDVGWQSDDARREKLDQERLRRIRDRAESLGFPIDRKLWEP